MQQQLLHILKAVRQQAPLVHNITNYVVMNNTANALLAIGASPIMSHAPEEAEDMVAICQSLVVNIGTMSSPWIGTMMVAAAKAGTLGKRWILDPVGAGATPFRDTTLEQLLRLRPTVIRGNASEIMALARLASSRTKGVDSTAQSDEALQAARWLSEEYGSVICISGATDLILSGDALIRISNGSPLMTRVTGLGCTASALVAACCAVTDSPLQATAAAMALLGVCGELAAAMSPGPGSLQLNLLDRLYNLSESEFTTTLRIA